MIFGFVMLLVAVAISLVAAYYSIAGLTAIFAAAVYPIIIMGGALELGKVIATVWLHNNWERVPRLFKLYLVPAVAFLMFLTSMGIFGFLSKAHTDQTLISGDVSSKIAIYDEKIKTSKENIEANRKALRQMDEAVDQSMARSTSETGADKAVAIRRGQTKERARLQAEMVAEQKNIAELNEQASPIRAEVRKVEAEVGPIKYIAALLYGDNPDANLLEAAVRWVIILIVLVFDPLALVLILASNKQFEWAMQGTGGWIHNNSGPVGPKPQQPNLLDRLKSRIKRRFPEPDPEVTVDLDQVNAELAELVDTKKQTQADVEAVAPEAEFFRSGADAELAQQIAKKDQELAELQTALAEIVDDYSKIAEQNNRSLERNLNLQIQVEDLKRQVSVTNNPMSMTERPGDYVDTTPEKHIPVIEPIENSEYVRVDGKVYGKDSLSVMLPELVPYADNAFKKLAGSRADFGTDFPTTPRKGDLFLRIDSLPNKLYKWNGAKWLEIDKNSTDSYAYNERYIEHLVQQLNNGTYDADDLNDAERDQIEQYLKGRNAQ